MGKSRLPKPYKTAMEMPGLTNRERFNAETSRKSCIHCHMIHNAENNQALAEGKSKESLFYRYPLPDNIGLTIDPVSGVKIAEVTPRSAADKAGLQAGEEVTHMNGQVIASIADMQWVLHHLPSKNATVTVTGSQSGEKTVRLSPTWKNHDYTWRGSMWSIPACSCGRGHRLWMMANGVSSGSRTGKGLLRSALSMEAPRQARPSKRRDCASKM